MPTFAANLSMLFTEVPFLERFALARQAGFTAVEFLFPYDFPAADIRAQLDQHQLSLVLHNLPCGDWNAGERGMACDPRRAAEFQQGAQLALGYALALGVKQLHCMAGIVPADITPEQARAAYIEQLRCAADLFAPHGIKLLIEPINHFDMPGYFLKGSAQASAIIADCGRENLFLQYDIYHMQRMEGELSNTIRALLPLIAHIQIADTPGRHEPGTGEINYPFLFKLLDELGYAGAVGCEYRPRADTASGLGWLAAAG
ncbi:hydroxypyruvate isomerase [Oxalobacteraceae bacterium]|nr:hydroxypyruvate isomerase [Oxalobacteraceae bacterium]